MIVTECVHAYSSSYTSLPRNSTWNTLGMDTEVVDTGGYHDNVTNNSRITFPSGGVFLVFGAPQWFDPNFDVGGRMTKNGTPTGYEYYVDGFAAFPTQLAGPAMFWLQNFSAGDYMETQTWNDAGSGTASARTQMAALEVDDFSCMVGDTTPSAATTLTFGTTVYDPHSMVTSSTTLTAQKAGYYLVLSVCRGFGSTRIIKNGSTAQYLGSLGSGYSPMDYVVDYFEVGDYVQVYDPSAETWEFRQFAMVFLDDQVTHQPLLAYTYDSIDLANTDPSFTGVIRTDSEWFDTGNGHPKGGYQYNISPAYCITCGLFNTLAGYHFSLAKISTDGGVGLQNDGLYTILNGSPLGNIFSTSRHQRGSAFTTVAFSCFQSVYGDTFAGSWAASALYTESAFTPWTNVFVTDVAQLNPQIYRRLEVPAS